MVDKENKYLYGELDSRIFVKFVGNSTMKNSKTLEDLFNRVFEGDKKQIIFDFQECLYMDSTILGVIAKTAARARKIWQDTIYAINIPVNIGLGLKSTGIDKFIEIIDLKATNLVEMHKLDNDDYKDRAEKAKHILEAHKTLMDLNDDNKRIFKNVVEMMEKELNK